MHLNLGQIMELIFLEPTVQSAGKEEKQEVSSPFSTNGERPKSNIVGRSESFNVRIMMCFFQWLHHVDFICLYM